MTAYGETFMEVVDLEERLTNPETGAYSELVKSIDALYGELSRHGVSEQAVLDSILRPGQIDYNLVDKVHVDNIDQTVAQLTSQIGALDLLAFDRNQLMDLVARYQSQVEQIKWMKEQIAAGKKSIESLAAKGELLLERVLKSSIETGEGAKTYAEKARTYMASLERQNFWMTAGVALGATLFGLLIVYWLSGRLTRQIRLIMDLFSEVGMGNFNARTERITRDELGQIAESLNAMLDNTMALIQTREERDRMQQSIIKLLNEISNLSEGDLTVRAEVTEDMTGSIADSFNMMAEQLGKIVREVKQATQQVGRTSSQMTSTTEKLAESSENQAVQITTVIAGINAMTAAIQKVARHAVESANVSEKSMRDAKEGAAAVESTNQAMESIRERVQETARAIKRLGESSQEIGNIVQIINDIADRTSILALNASIQAAMAGDAGCGFSVVAEEVQRLSEQSTNSTKQIETLVKTIQGEINEAGTRMEESIQRVVEGSQLAVNAHKKLKEIESVSAQLGQRVQSISAFAKQQTKVSEKISDSMKVIGNTSSKTATVSRQAASVMKNLAATSEKLRVSVETFKVEDGGNGGVAHPIAIQEKPMDSAGMEKAA